MTIEGLVTLSEYTSRETVLKLANLCLEELQYSNVVGEKSQDEAVKALSARLGVNPRIVRRWMEGKLPFHRGEVDALIAYSFKIQPHKAAKILKRDLDTHRRMLFIAIVKAILTGEMKPEAET